MINLENASLTASGTHGSYYKLSSSVGVKVIHSKVFKTPAKAHNSKAYRQAVKEAENLEEAFETGYVPKCYGVTLLKVRGGFRVGVLMQHLGNKVLSETEFYDRADIYDEIQESLEEIGIYHNDLHEDNIMVYRGKFYAIDFSPECVEHK